MVENTPDNIAECLSEQGYCVGEAFGFDKIIANCEEESCEECWDAFMAKIKTMDGKRFKYS